MANTVTEQYGCGLQSSNKNRKRRVINEEQDWHLRVYDIQK